MLSLLALHEFYDVKVEIEYIDLENNVYENAKFQKFVTALKSLSMEPIDWGQRVNWNHMFLIKIDGLAVGAFNPQTIVFTGIQYNELLKKKSFTLKDENGFLRPPYEDNEDEEGYLFGWLQRVRSEVSKLAQNQNDRESCGNQILSELDKWIIELRDRQRNPKDGEFYTKKSLFDIDPNIPKDRYNIYRVVSSWWHIERTESERSDFSLNNDRKTDTELILLVPELIDKKKNWGSIKALKSYLNDNNPPEVVIKNHFTQDYCGDNYKIENKIYKLSEARKVLWIKPDKYFLAETLLRSKDKNMPFLTNDLFQSNSGTQYSQYILPLKEEILQYFSPETILKKLKPKISEDQGVVSFSIELPIVNKGKEEFFTVTKKYSLNSVTGEGLIKEIDIPVIDIFPNYLGKNWKHYYIFQSNPSEFVIKPILEESAKLREDGERRHPDSSEKKECKVVSVNGDKCFPEALSVQISGQNIPAGIIFIPKNDAIDNVPHDIKRVVGIDFGTTNTNIYIQDNDELAKKWEFDFREHFFKITNSSDQARNQLLDKYFFPNKKVKFPTPTAIRIFDLTADRRLSMDYFAYFMDDFVIPSNVYTNIKWEEVSQNEQTTKQRKYFKSLLFLVLLDAASKSKTEGKNRVQELKLWISFPKVFSQTELIEFRAAWKSSLQELIFGDYSTIIVFEEDAIGNSGIKIKGLRAGDQEDVLRYETEGRASGEYFASDKMMLGDKASSHAACVCFDVGGGTTDISIWGGDNEMVSDSSVLLAGRHITQMFHKNNNLRSVLFSSDIVTKFDVVKGDFDKFASVLNHALKAMDIKNILPTNAGNKEVKWLRKMIMLEFGAIAYYTAMVAYASSKNDPDAQIVNRLQNRRFKCYWGGNAAQYIHWLDSGTFQEGGFADGMLNSLFGRAIYDMNNDIKPKNIMTILSPDFKSEASGGVVLMGGNPVHYDETYLANQRRALRTKANANAGTGTFDDMDNNSNNFDKIVTGEDLEMKTGQTISFVDYIDVASLYSKDDKLLVRNISTNKFERFIKTLNFFGTRCGLLDNDNVFVFNEKEQEIVSDKVMQGLIVNLKLPLTKRKLEPIFIHEARAYIEYLISLKA
ncbi:MAG TPA: hypothetical protein PLZ43_11825 [bacterium]|nr:hypothetical protein [bacterium]